MHSLFSCCVLKMTFIIYLLSRIRTQHVSSFKIDLLTTTTGTERIISLQFSPDDSYLVVSSNRRILLLSLLARVLDFEIENDFEAPKMKVYAVI